MPTLYTPEAKTQGLDWLAGMVQSGQKLWQQERSLEQDAKRLQLAQQQQKMQAEQFWASQARLADQQEFQNRKFMYEVGSDRRDYDRKVITDDRMFERVGQVQDRDFTLRQQTENRQAVDQAWDMDPTNPLNENQEAETEWIKQRIEKGNRGPFDGLLPTGQPGVSNAGTTLLPDESKPDGVWQTGNPAAPFQWTAPDGTKSWLEMVGVGANGPFFQTRSEKKLAPKDMEKARQDEIDDMRTRISSFSSAKKPLPAYPTSSTSLDGKPTSEQVTAYESRVTEVEKTNKILDQQIAATSRDLRMREAQARLDKVNFNIKPTEKFANVWPQFVDAVTRKDVTALENLRVQIKPLADDGDPAAKEALRVLDNVFGAEESAAGRTGLYKKNPMVE